MLADRQAQATGDEPLLGLHDHLDGLVRQFLSLEESLMRRGRLLLEGLHRAQPFLYHLQGANQVCRGVLLDRPRLGRRNGH